MSKDRLKKAALIVAGLFVALLAFAWLALPGILQSQAQRLLAERGGHQLTMAKPEIHPFELSLRLRDLKLADAQGAPLLAFAELFVDLSAASVTARTLVFDAVSLDGLDVKLEQRKEGGLNWTPLLDAFKSGDAPAESGPPPRLDIRKLQLRGAQLDFADRRTTPEFATHVDPLDLDLEDISTLPDDQGRFRVNAKTGFGAQLAWQGELTLNPVAGSGRIELTGVDLARLAPLLRERLPLPPPAGVLEAKSNYRLTLEAGKPVLRLDGLALALASLQLRAGDAADAPKVDVERVEAAAGTLDLATRQLAFERLTLAGNRVELPRPGGAPGAALSLRQIEIATPSVDLEALRINAVSLALNDNRLSFPPAGKTPGPAIEVKRVSLAAPKVDLGERQATLDALRVEGGQIAAVRRADGTIDLFAAIEGLRPAPTASGPASAGKPRKSGQAARPGQPVTPAAPEPAAPPWKFAVGEVALAGFTFHARDEGVSPAAQLALHDIGIEARNVSDRLATPLPVKAHFAFKSGGSFDANGKITPADGAAELQFKLSDLALSPAAPYVGRFAALDFASGRGSVDGRVRHDAKATGFRGGFAVRDLRLDEAGSKNVFLAWKSLASREVDADLKRLDIGLLTLDGLDTKLLIAKDKSTNIQRILRQPPPPAVPPDPAANPATTAEAPKPPAAPAPKQESTPPAAPAYTVSIDRLRIADGALDFADESLVLPFGTRIHHLRGNLSGLSTQPGAPGQIELDGDVDDYGLARAVGQVDLFRPTDFMDLKVVFRNVEMTRLTPYSATFAGRKIDTGKLSLDLEYKIKQRQLQGENNIVIDRLQLGERVQSATAKDLPLDLAIAILSDSDGRIDLGLPISGSLDDPQFSYGQIVWKAITNILTKIVTAPFRALGALFGGGGEKLESIAFDAGEATLSPPEREKLTRIATILNKRPGLALAVAGTWAEGDRAALRDVQARRAVAAKAGQPLDADGDPGPLSTRNPKTQAALETLFGDKFGAGELAALKEGYRAANPGKLEESMTGKMMSRLSGLLREQRKLSESEVGDLKGKDFHGVLFERLRAAEKVGDDALQALAQRRGEHALGALKQAGAPAARLKSGAVEKIETEGDVALKIGLDKAGG